ncbi:MAG TPA: hypothetical protein VND23_00835 [Acidimicrobiales bacterium]|nr:hypothetical protein [Acidimicrobiales bacterium]
MSKVCWRARNFASAVYPPVAFAGWRRGAGAGAPAAARGVAGLAGAGARFAGAGAGARAGASLLAAGRDLCVGGVGAVAAADFGVADGLAVPAAFAPLAAPDLTGESADAVCADSFGGGAFAAAVDFAAGAPGADGTLVGTDDLAAAAAEVVVRGIVLSISSRGERLTISDHRAAVDTSLVAKLAVRARLRPDPMHRREPGRRVTSRPVTF